MQAPPPPHSESPEARRSYGAAAALDVGRARIGVAVTDPDALVSRPLDVVHRKGTRKDLAAIGRMLRRHDIAVWVVGLPTATEGSDDMHRLARGFAKRLAETTDAPVFLVDEADTSAEAHAELRAFGLRNARRRQVVDKVAAARILDRWLRGEPAIAVAAPAPEPGTDEPGTDEPGASR